MWMYKNIAGRFRVTLFTLILLSPVLAQAASDEEIAAMRAQMMALSERLDRLEAENRELAAANAELAKSQQETAVTVATVSDKTDAVAAEVEEKAATTSWTESIRWKGDFRYRYETIDVEDKPNRDRNRIRARAALVANVTPTVEVGLGLASGGDDPVSTNQTLGGGGTHKDINIDLAYFDWSGLQDTHIYGGKFTNYVHRTGKNALLWDSDWRPEGSGIGWNNGKFFANALGTWIESDSASGQSFAYLTQAGFKLPIGDALTMTAGVGYHNFDTKGSGSFFGDDDDFFGNSYNRVTNTYLYDYEVLELFTELNFDMFGRPTQLFGNWVQNQAVDENDTAYAFGFTYGSAKNKGDWEFGYVYQKLEADSLLGLLTDSDYGGGGTDAKGSIFKGSYALVKNINADFTYFLNDVGLKSGNPKDYKRLQLDLNFKY
jgi:hypothetical protein